jgi:hypothetical protein
MMGAGPLGPAPITVFSLLVAGVDDADVQVFDE